MTATIRCWWDKLKQCDKLLYRNCFFLKLRNVYQTSNYVWERSMVPGKSLQLLQKAEFNREQCVEEHSSKIEKELWTRCWCQEKMKQQIS